MTILTDERDEPTPEEMALLKRQAERLYEMRLAELGPDGRDDERRARLWACSCFSEAMHIFEHILGVEGAHELGQCMLDSRRDYAGPRERRMRH